jgi:hypothetical protein
VVFFPFQKKKQKALVLLRRRNKPSVEASQSYRFWFFSGKEQNYKRPHDLFNSSSGIFLFPEKETKSVSSASQKVMGYPKLGEADPGGLGACPQKPTDCV